MVAKGTISYLLFCIAELCFLIRHNVWQECVLDWDVALFRAGQYVLLALLVAFVFDKRTSQDMVGIINFSRILNPVLSAPFLSKILQPERYRMRTGLHGLMPRAVNLLVAKFIVFMLVRMALLLLYAILVYPLTGMRRGVERFLAFYLIVLAHQWAIAAGGFLISACFKDTLVMVCRIMNKPTTFLIF